MLDLNTDVCGDYTYCFYINSIVGKVHLNTNYDTCQPEPRYFKSMVTRIMVCYTKFYKQYITGIRVTKSRVIISTNLSVRLVFYTKIYHNIENVIRSYGYVFDYTGFHKKGDEDIVENRIVDGVEEEINAINDDIWEL